MFGQDPGDVRVRFRSVAQNVARRNEVEQRHVLDGARAERDFSRSRSDGSDWDVGVALGRSGSLLRSCC
jgi:hypothetical protein